METVLGGRVTLMADISPETIKRMIKEVAEEMKLSSHHNSEKNTKTPASDGPKVLIVFHAGVGKLDEAMKQVGLIQESAGKSGIFTEESARSWVCGEDVKKQTGARCILDTVKPDGLEKVLNKADVLVLPTFCFKTGAKVASLICDDHESRIVLAALAQGKIVLASRDGFLITESLSNIKIREEIDRIFGKLEEYGVVFSPTDQLSNVFRKVALAPGKSTGKEGKRPQDSENKPLLRIVTARDIDMAVNEKKGSIRVATRGLVTPLARDLAKEYGISIIRG
jgi:glycosyltransferase involved in cell wall biosynthesis